MSDQNFGLRLRFSGAYADQNLLDAYDGSKSLAGFARALQITTQAYINKDFSKVATKLKNADIYIKPARQGSFLIDFITRIKAKASGVIVNPSTYYDFIGFALNQAVGNTNGDPQTSYVKSLIGPDQPTFDHLAEVLEGSLQDAHRSISEKTVSQITLERPRGEKIAIFNQQTAEWVNTRDTDAVPEKMIGNVTRYNTQSPNGRAYIDIFDRIVPFKRCDTFIASHKQNLTWSLHEHDRIKGGKLEFEARRVISASGQVKRLIVSDCMVIK